MSTIEKAAELARLNELLESHREIKLQLNLIKEEEKIIRLKIVDYYKEKGFNTVGTHTFYCMDLSVKMSIKLNYKLDEELLNEIIKDLGDEELNCITYTPKLKLAAYKKLENSNNLDKAIITTPALPALEIHLKTKE